MPSSHYATGHRKYVIDVLAILFGIGAWVAVNGIWVELPVLVSKLPEGWSLPSYLSVITQIANVGPIAYGVLHRLWPRYVHETSATVSMMSVGVVACLLLALFWQRTVVFAGASHSVSLFALVFFVSLVDCTSSVVFLPFMATFRDIYLLSYFIGEGLSGFLPSLVALAQGVGGNAECVNVSFVNVTDNETEYRIDQVSSEPNFSADIFFYFLCAMMVVSYAAFLLLRFLPMAVEEHAPPSPSTTLDHSQSSTTDSQDSGMNETTSIYDSGDSAASYGTDCHVRPSSDWTKRKDDVCLCAPQRRQLWTHFYLLFIQAWVSFYQNGVLLSIQSYSCLPYGNVAYHLTVTLSNIANPLASFVAFFLPVHKTWIITVETVLATLFGTYILVLAVLSPYPPLMDTTAGTALVVLAWILFSGLVSHVKASLGTIFREEGSRALFWCGAITQVGSAIGAILMFLLVDVYYLFKSYDPCIS